MEKYEVIIIGAGASGIMCALNSARKTLLIEAGERIGKKILATGNGKCNITNNHLESKNYNTPLVEKYFSQFNNAQTLSYFENLGIFTYADQEGRRYPISNSANTVLDILLKALSLKKNVTVLTNTMPLTITNHGNEFVIVTGNNQYACNNTTEKIFCLS